MPIMMVILSICPIVYNTVHQLGKDVDNQANWTATFVRRIQQAENKPG